MKDQNEPKKREGKRAWFKNIRFPSFWEGIIYIILSILIGIALLGKILLPYL
ncbi:hypothetical protein [Mucilaginibacter sp. MD40]|jgi:hypothetical protein|uniref:hypothetical protein n=1 Tax=Mucilaginibacter sp. MD40 TaxID=2029590 RepID=UPI000AE4AF32|nr:hypothetical protein [Mucilaginibacter sp. MD40]